VVVFEAKLGALGAPAGDRATACAAVAPEANGK
jgi:hypothetical protein